VHLGVLRSPSCGFTECLLGAPTPTCLVGSVENSSQNAGKMRSENVATPSAIGFKTDNRTALHGQGSPRLGTIGHKKLVTSWVRTPDNTTVTTSGYRFYRVHHHNHVSRHNRVEFITPSTLALYTKFPQLDGVQNCVESLQAVSCRSCKIPMLHTMKKQLSLDIK
jgi:hypothetical protein